MMRLFPFGLALLFFAGLAMASAHEIKPPGERERCPVCGMFVHPYQEWIATILYDDGTQVYFDGCKDLFTFYFGLSSEQQQTIQQIYVTEYYSTELMPADQVFYILGSDVFGPMGKELIPVSGEAAAKEFFQDHQGRAILRYSELSPETLKSKDLR